MLFFHTICIRGKLYTSFVVERISRSNSCVLAANDVGNISGSSGGSFNNSCPSHRSYSEILYIYEFNRSACISNFIFLFYWGWPAYSAYIAYIVIYTCLVYVRLILMNKQIGFPINIFLKQVIGRIVSVTVLSFILPIILNNIMGEGFLRLISVGFVSTLSLVVSMFYIGMQKSERVQVVGFIRNKLYHIYSKEL